MESNESGGLSSYYHHHQVHHQQSHQPPQPQHHHQNNSTGVVTSPPAISASPTNGILPNTERPPPMVYPHPVSSTVTPPVETLKRKRGRPRKYGTPEAAAAAKRAMSSVSPPKKKEYQIGAGAASSSSSFAKKKQSGSLGNAGQSFTPHIVSVASGEDVHQKIMLFMQQSKHEICIMSASGSIFNPCLLQPAAAGGHITYEGHYNILSLSGSYIRTEYGGKSGAMSVCLSSNDGQIVGGAIGGSLRAAGPVQVIVATFLSGQKKDDPRGNDFTGN